MNNLRAFGTYKEGKKLLWTSASTSAGLVPHPLLTPNNCASEQLEILHHETYNPLLTFLGFVAVAPALPLSDSGGSLSGREQYLEERFVDTYNLSFYSRHFGSTYEIAEQDYNYDAVKAKAYQ